MNLEHFGTFSLSLIHHFIMVKGLDAPVMVSQGGSSECSKAPDKEHYTKAAHTALIDLTHSGSRHGVGANNGGQGFAHGTGSSAAWTSNLGQSSHCLNTCRRV